jgi:hypothetical protein
MEIARAQETADVRRTLRAVARELAEVRRRMAAVARPPALGELAGGQVSVPVIAWLVLRCHEAIADLTRMHERGQIDAREYLARSAPLLEGVRALAAFVSAEGRPS